MWNDYLYFRYVVYAHLFVYNLFINLKTYFYFFTNDGEYYKHHTVWKPKSRAQININK